MQVEQERKNRKRKNSKCKTIEVRTGIRDKRLHFGVKGGQYEKHDRLHSDWQWNSSAKLMVFIGNSLWSVLALYRVTGVNLQREVQLCLAHDPATGITEQKRKGSMMAACPPTSNKCVLVTVIF